MNINLSRTMIGLFSALALSACTTSQPVTSCTVAYPATDGHAAKYTLKPGQSVTGACAQKKGEEIGFFKYYPKIDTAQGPRQDYQHPRIALRTDTLGNIDVDDATVTSFGTFTALTPDANDMCTIPTMSTATQTYQKPDTTTDTISYEWSNVRVLNRPDALGTQVAADLKYTEGGCTAEYSVRAVWPRIACESDDNPGTPDQRKCYTTPHPSEGVLNVSGIDPDFPVECDPDLLFCVLSEDVPAFN